MYQRLPGRGAGLEKQSVIMLSTDLFDYQLPAELIAQHPAPRRDGSRMLVLNCRTGEYKIESFGAIVNYLSAGDLLVYNDTKVLRGRMYARKNGLAEGAKFELLLVRQTGPDTWSVLLKPGKRATAGTWAVLLDDQGNLGPDSFSVLGKNDDDTYLVKFSNPDAEHLQKVYGHIPLPPYINRGDENADQERYQTIFAAQAGAVAAPTAGLHFTPEIIRTLKQKGVNETNVTLHVGPGTFKTVSVPDVSKHQMHLEEYFLTAGSAQKINATKAAKHKVIAVGTTTVRVLESCVNPDGTVRAQSGDTGIFLYPPHEIKSVDMLLTNFHLPKSTLLMLVSCFCPREKVLAAYQYAIDQKMRFFSYGDCMLLI